MRAPTESNPAYKKRAISAMLEQPASHELSHSGWNLLGTWTPKVVSSVVGLTLLSAVSVFLVLCHHDTSVASVPRTIPAVVTDERDASAEERTAMGQGALGRGSVSLEKQDQAVLSPADARDGNSSVAEPVEFKINRSRAYQTVGTVGLKLLRVNPRRRTCDISIQSKNRRTLQKRLQLNRPFRVNPTFSADPLLITVSTISRDSITGSLSALPASLSAPKSND